MTSPPPADITAIVLAGGRSTRFGTDKASVVIGGRPMLDRVCATLAPEVPRVVVVAASGQPLPPVSVTVEIVRDLFPGSGPLGGIVSGLAATSTNLGFVAASDLPLLDPSVVPLLAGLADAVDVVTF